MGLIGLIGLIRPIGWIGEILVMSFRWKGVFPAVTTQFTRDQSLDLNATARHIEALIESVGSGLVMLESRAGQRSARPSLARSRSATLWTGPHGGSKRWQISRTWSQSRNHPGTCAGLRIYPSMLGTGLPSSRGWTI